MAMKIIDEEQVWNIKKQQYENTNSKMPNVSTNDLYNKQKELSSKIKRFQSKQIKKSPIKSLLRIGLGFGLKTDDKYDKLKNEYDDVTKQIEDKKLKEKQTTTQKIGNVVSGNIMTGVKGVESMMNKAKKTINNPLNPERKISPELTYAEKKGQVAIEQTKNPIAKTGLNVLGSVSRMVPQIALGGGSPLVSTAVGFMNYGGGAYNEAKREGKSEADATKYGIAIGTLEMGLQNVLGGLSSIYGKSALSGVTSKVMQKVVKNPQIRNYVANIGSEGLEEYLQDILNPVVRNVTMGEKNKVKAFTPEALESGILGALTAGLIESPTLLSKNTTKSQINAPIKDNTEQTNVQNNVNIPIKQEQVLNVPQNKSNEIIAPIKETNKLNNNVAYSENLTEYLKLSEMYYKNKDLSKTNEIVDKMLKIEDTLTPEELKEVYRIESKNLNVEDNNQFESINKQEKQKVNIPTKKDIDIPIQQKTNNTEILEETPVTKTSLLSQYKTGKTTLGEMKDKFIQKTTNKGHYVDKLAKETGNQELKFKYDKTLSANAEGQYSIGEAQTNNKGEIIGKSINEIWKPVEDSNLVKEFSEYLLHKHNIDRSRQGKNIFGNSVSTEDSMNEVRKIEKEYPQFIEWSKDLNTFNKNELKNMTEAGLTSKETEEYLNATYENYIKIARDKENMPIDKKYKNTKVNNPIKRAVFSSADILPLKDSMAEQVIKTKKAIRRNDLGIELLNTLNNGQEVEDFDVDNIIKQDKNGATFTVFQDGKPVNVPISKELYESLSNDDEMYLRKLENDFSLVTKPLQKASQFQRGILTQYSPTFMITNPLKDIQDGVFNSKYPTKFAKNIVRATEEIATKGKYYQEYMANGGESNTYFDYKHGILKEKKGLVAKFLNKISEANEKIEQTPRLAEYISTREAGKSITEAMYNAAEVTTNFKRGGEVTKFANRNGATFLNASVQGLSKQFRNLTGQNGIKGYTNLAIKTTLLGVAPAVLNHLLLSGDDDYEDLPDSDKDLYYLFKTSDEKFIRIPKGRVLSVIGSTARRMIEKAQGEEDAFKGLGQTAINQLGPNNPVEDNVGAPIYQAVKGKTWYGGELIPLRLQNELPKNQWDETTDSFSKWLGQTLNISPKKINYVLDQYSGGVGDIILPYMTPQAESNPFSAKFTTDSVMKNKNVSKFFETAELQQKKANDSEATEKEKLKSKYLNSVRSDTNDLYKEKREIQMSDISDKKKKEQIRLIQAEINGILESGLETYKDTDIKSNYARVGDKEYYKNSKNEWEKVDDDECNEISNLNFNYNDYYKFKSTLSDISKQYKTKEIDSEVLKEQKNSSKKGSIINQLLKSGFNDEQKNYIYSKQYSDANEVITAGIPYDLYLKLENAIKDIKSVDDSKSNIAGKTISGSKKEQILKEIQKLPTTRRNKLMLYAMKGYSLNSNEKTEIFNYVNNLKLSANKKKEVLKKMSGFQWLENGNLKGW